MIKINNSAVDFLKKKNIYNLKVRILVRGGGCKGFERDVMFVNTCEKHDLTWKQNDLEFIVDKKSSEILSDCVLVATNVGIETKLEFIDPENSSSCSCGKSFSP